MTAKKLYTPAEVIEARTKIFSLSTDALLKRGYINIQAVLGNNADFVVILIDHGGKKIQVIKEVRALTGLGLGESKALVDTVPSVILRELSRADAVAAATRLRSEGAAAVARKAVSA